MSYMTSRDKLSAEAIALYKQYVPTAQFVVVDHASSNWSLSDSNLQMLAKYGNRKGLKRFRLINCSPISSSLIPYTIGMSLGVGSLRAKKGRVIFSDRVGAFKLEFSDGSVMILIKYYCGAGSNLAVATLLASEEEVFYKYLNATKEYNKVNSKPKVGISTIKFDSQGNITYEKIKKIQHTPVIHPSVEAVTKDLDNYFANVSEFTKYGMSGVRKVLLVGPPGTGKSSYAYQIASRHKDTKSIAFANNVNAVASHLYKCSKSNVPTIIIWEDAESSGLSRAGSSILNFLDGIDQPQTKQGAYIIMTTNFPEQIDARIKKRPGRVDRIFEFGVLKGEYALACAQVYFEDLFPYKLTDQSEEAKEHFLKLMNLTTGMSGASIKGLAYSSKLYAAGNNLEITLDLVKTVKEDLSDDLAKIDRMAAEEVSKIGFGSSKSVEYEVIDWEQVMISGE